jgi:hypothetical protein
MKKILYIFLAALFSISCNDDEIAPAPEESSAVLTRISRNGFAVLEFNYDLKNRLYRMNFLNATSGELVSYTLYEYNENGPVESRRYSADTHSLNQRTVFTVNAFGRVTKAENYQSPDFFGEVANYREYEYNVAGQLIVKRLRAEGEPINYIEEYTYDDKGNLIKFEFTYNPTLKDQSFGVVEEYVPRDQSIPNLWQDHVRILDLSGVDQEIRNMFNSNVHQIGWNNAGTTSETRSEFSGHVFDDNGNLIYQLITRKYILPENTDLISEMTYDYENVD